MPFESPNFTQAPNDFFDMISDMTDAELKVTLVMIRNTFGFHRKSFKMSLRKLQEATGLSRNAVRSGAEKAEQRGTFRRANPEDISRAEWELVVGGQSVTPGGQPVTPDGSTSDPEVGQPLPYSTGPKESIKQNTKEKDGVDFYLDQLQQPSEKEIEIEDFLILVEKKFQINEITRSSKNQTSAWKVIKDMKENDRTFDQFVAWVKSSKFNWDGRRFYKDIGRLWSDWPQAFPEEDASVPKVEKGKAFLA